VTADQTPKTAADSSAVGAGPTPATNVPNAAADAGAQPQQAATEAASGAAPPGDGNGGTGNVGGGGGGGGGDRSGIVEIQEDVAPKPLTQPKELAYDPEPARDEARKWLAYSLVLLLSVIVMFSYFSLWRMSKDKFDSLKALLELVLGPVVALVGSATGFYFGGGRSGKS
jgi:hypothetical protein